MISFKDYSCENPSKIKIWNIMLKLYSNIDAVETVSWIDGLRFPFQQYFSHYHIRMIRVDNERLDAIEPCL